MGEQAHIHHYVPQWYQKRFFLPGQTRYFYLDLKPERVTRGATTYTRRDLLNWGSARCFFKENLYTISFPTWTSDQIEKHFFGQIDTTGREAVDFFGDYKGYDQRVVKLFPALSPYMDAQRFRTPRGLDQLKSLIHITDHNQALLAMQRLFTLHTTMWSEGIWEFVRARKTQTKFIVSDEPVTFFNRFILHNRVKYPGGIELDQVGTRTIFPLSLDACLIITHTELARNPRIKPDQARTNPRAYQTTMKYLRDFQYGRELEEDEVLRINYIIKRRATRYIAAANKDWLYPERYLSSSKWVELDSDWFLLPHLFKVPFRGDIIVGFRDGGVWINDEYGRTPAQRGYGDERRRNTEFETFQLSKHQWSRKRIGKSVAHVDEHDAVGDEIMQEYLRNQGLLPSIEPFPDSQ